MEDLKKQIEEIVRGLMIKGYEAGRKQHDTPYKYTLNTDEGEKEWQELLTLFSKTMGSIIGEDEEVSHKEWVATYIEAKARNKLRNEQRQKLNSLTGEGKE